VTRRLGLGDVLAGRFQLVADVGEGGMGRVFEALDLKHDRSAAVKVIYRRLAHDPEFRTRFAREAEAAERANHPHVLPVWSYGEDDGHLYLVTPLCDTDLAGLIEDRGPLEVTRALSVTSQVAWALDWAHGRDIVHRDVKPENILLVAGPAEPHAYLGDFGLAKVATNATLTRHGTAAGLSPAYAAPEQWRADRVTPATDQYALAGTLY
jgi:serine/threonine protein kinase